MVNNKKMFVLAALLLVSGGSMLAIGKKGGYAEQVPSPNELANAFVVRGPNATVVGFINSQYKGLSNKQSRLGRTKNNKFRTLGQKLLVANLIEGLIVLNQLELAQNALDYYAQAVKDARYNRLAKRLADAKAGLPVVAEETYVEEPSNLWPFGGEAVYVDEDEAEARAARSAAIERYEQRASGEVYKMGKSRAAEAAAVAADRARHRAAQQGVAQTSEYDVVEQD